MTQLFVILLMTVVLLALGIRLLMQARSHKGRIGVSIDDFTRAREALDNMFVESAAVQRIFAKEDAEFVKRIGARNVRELFLRERKKLAVRWVRNIQQQLAELMDLHLRLAAYTYGTHPGFEFTLTLKYASFRALCSCVLVMLWVFGPFRTSEAIRLTLSTASHLCSGFSLRLDEVNPALLRQSQQYVAS